MSVSNLNGTTSSSTFVAPRNVVYNRPAPSFDKIKNVGAVLRSGSRGPSVAQLQENLNILLAHYKPFEDLPTLAVDQDLGPLTLRTVWWVQEHFNLNKLDGLVGPETLGKIEELVAGIRAGKAVNEDSVTAVVDANDKLERVSGSAAAESVRPEAKTWVKLVRPKVQQPKPPVLKKHTPSAVIPENLKEELKLEPIKRAQVVADIESIAGEWDKGARSEWLAAKLENKKLLANEPRTNAPNLITPPWLSNNIDKFMDAHGLRKIGDDGKVTYHPLAGVDTGYKNSEVKPGGELKPTKTTHFVVHETDGLTSLARLRRQDDDETATMFIGRDDFGRRQQGHYLGMDYTANMSGTNWNSKAKNKGQVRFVSAELVTKAIPHDSKEKQIYSEQQYRDVALAYVMASHRAGRFATIVPHREVDRGKFPDGRTVGTHSCPRNFNWDKLYGEINKLTGLPEGTTYGYQSDRDSKNYGGVNQKDHLNTFPNIYGDVQYFPG